jgi:hypothetical protein
MSVILVTQEAEAEGSQRFKASLGKQDPNSKNIQSEKGWWSGSSGRDLPGISEVLSSNNKINK